MRFTADTSDAGKRLDFLLHERLPEHSRSRIQQWIKAGRVLVNGAAARSSYLVRPGDAIEAEPAEAPPLHASAEDIPLQVLYEDADIVAIDKPAGMVVHAGAGVHAGTVVNALLHRFETLSGVGGAIAARDRPSPRPLHQRRAVGREERRGAPQSGGAIRRARGGKDISGAGARQSGARRGRIERPIARDPVQRTRMTARLDRGRAAWSEYRVLRRFEKFTLLEVRIGTGRTHQIRVHLSSIGHAVAGDTLYGAPARTPGMPPLGRYFLHAHRIRIPPSFERGAERYSSRRCPKSWKPGWRASSTWV